MTSAVPAEDTEQATGSLEGRREAAGSTENLPDGTEAGEGRTGPQSRPDERQPEQSPSYPRTAGHPPIYKYNPLH